MAAFVAETNRLAVTSVQLKPISAQSSCANTKLFDWFTSHEKKMLVDDDADDDAANWNAHPQQLIDYCERADLEAMIDSSYNNELSTR